MKTRTKHTALLLIFLIIALVLGAYVLQGCAAFSPEKEVKVLDNKYDSIPGFDINSGAVITHYSYDDSGKIISASQSTNYSGADLNLCKSLFEYDDQGRLIKVSDAYEQYDWNIGNTEEFAYDDSGRCSSYTFTVTSQGTGTQQYSYEYDSSGVIDFGSVTSYLGPQDIEGTTSLSWAYKDSGLIESVSSSGMLGFSIDEGLSDEQSRTFCYKDKYGVTSVLYFDEAGLLTGIDTASSTGTHRTTYEYKTIIVDSREYTPTVYSNPTGFDVQWKPQYSEREISNIVNR